MTADLMFGVPDVADGRPKARRGTTNRNDRGSSYARRARKQYLLDTYRADADLYDATDDGRMHGVTLGQGVPACRCYRCGQLLSIDTVTVDRIKPGCEGGTYRRDNIRPACATCNEDTGRRLGHERTRAKKLSAAGGKVKA